MARFLKMAVSCCLLAGATAQPTTNPVATPTNRPAGTIADLLASANRMSELAPCGCQSNMQGGIPRESAYVKTLKAEGVPMLMLDAGGMIHGTATPSNFLKTRYLFESIGQMGYEVINVGFTDMTYGVDFLREQAQRHGFEWVSCSVMDPKTKTALFSPYVIKNVQGADGKMLRVAITGFTRPRMAEAVSQPAPTPTPMPTPRVPPMPTERKRGIWVPAPGHYQIMARETPAPPVNTAFIEAVERSKAEQQRALSAMSAEQATEQRLQAIRNLLSNTETVYSGTGLNGAETVYHAPMTQPLIDSQPIETPAPSPTPFHGIEPSSPATELMVLPKAGENEYVAVDPRPILKQLIPELRSQADFVVVLGHYPRRSAEELMQDIPGVDVLIAGYGSSEEPEIVTADGMTVVGPGYTGRSVARMSLYRDEQGAIQTKGEIVAINENLGSDPAVEALMADYTEKTKALPVEEVADVNYTLAGAEVCRECHEEPYAKWKTMRHSHAFQTLEEKNQHFNPDCLPCHTTSYLKDNGFRSLATTPQFINVQCESCHGPSLQHAQHERNLKLNPNSVPTQPQLTDRIPKEDVCRQCHTEKTDPKFDYATKFPIIAHQDSKLVRRNAAQTQSTTSPLGGAL